MRPFALTTIAFLSVLSLFAADCGPQVVGSGGDETGGSAAGEVGGRSHQGGTETASGGEPNGEGGAAKAAGGDPSGGSGGAAVNKGGAKASGGGAAGGSAASKGGSSGTGATNVPSSPECSEDAAVWDTTEQYGQDNYDAGNITYFIRNNFWNQSANGAGEQKVWAKNSRCWGVHAKHTDANPAGTVKGYPDIARGWTLGNNNGNNGLAIQVSKLTKATIRWKMKAPTDGRAWALWDIYFHESENASTGNQLAAVNLMIQQRIVDDSNWMQQDSGSWNKVTLAGIAFREKLETKTVSSTRDRIQLYVNDAAGKVLGKDDMMIDLKTIVDHYVESGKIKSTDWLTSIQAGYEIVEGGDYVTQDFWTALNEDPWPK